MVFNVCIFILINTQYETEEEVKEVNIYLGIQDEVLLGVAKDMVMSGFVRPCVGGGGGSSPKLVGNYLIIIASLLVCEIPFNAHFQLLLEEYKSIHQCSRK